MIDYKEIVLKERRYTNPSERMRLGVYKVSSNAYIGAFYCQIALIIYKLFNHGDMLNNTDYTEFAIQTIVLVILGCAIMYDYCKNRHWYISLYISSVVGIMFGLTIGASKDSAVYSPILLAEYSSIAKVLFLMQVISLVLSMIRYFENRYQDNKERSILNKNRIVADFD